MPSNESDWSDEFEIRALVDRYCDAVNRRDVPLWLETWNDDPHWELFGRPTQGREAALGVLQGALETTYSELCINPSGNFRKNAVQKSAQNQSKINQNQLEML